MTTKDRKLKGLIRRFDKNQLMLTSAWFIAIAVLFTFLFSCSSTAPNDDLLRRLEGTLTDANESMKRSNANALEQFALKQADPITKEKASFWWPKIRKIDSCAGVLLTYLDSIKTNVNERSVRKKYTDEIYSRLIRFKTTVVPMQHRMKEIPVFTKNFQYNVRDDTSTHYLAAASVAEFKVFLASIKNEVLRAENDGLLICLDQLAIVTPIFTSFKAIVGQNTKVLRAGDSLEITAGIGSFEKDSTLIVTINGKNVGINSKGMAIHRVKTSQKPGSYSMPVGLQFIDEDGKQQSYTFNVEYRLVGH